MHGQEHDMLFSLNRSRVPRSSGPAEVEGMAESWVATCLTLVSARLTVSPGDLRLAGKLGGGDDLHGWPSTT